MLDVRAADQLFLIAIESHHLSSSSIGSSTRAPLVVQPSLTLFPQHVCRVLVSPESPGPGDPSIHPPDTYEPFSDLQNDRSVLVWLRTRLNNRSCRHAPCSSWLLPCHHAFHRRGHCPPARVSSTQFPAEGSGRQGVGSRGEFASAATVLFRVAARSSPSPPGASRRGRGSRGCFAKGRRPSPPSMILFAY